MYCFIFVFKQLAVNLNQGITDQLLINRVVFHSYEIFHTVSKNSSYSTCWSRLLYSKRYTFIYVIK
jgi:hypothetical protein